MEIVIINAVLYIATFIHFYKKSKRFDISSFLLLLYSLIAILSIYHYFANQVSQIQLWPFLYLYITVVLFIRPSFHFDLYKLKILIVESEIIQLLKWVFIISGIVSTIYSIPQTLDNFYSGEWNQLRNIFYDDKNDILLYSNQFERFFKNFNSYFIYLGIILGFYQITKPNINRIQIGLLFGSVIIPSFLMSTLVASRGLVVFLFFNLVIGYLFFRNSIPEHRRKKFVYVSILLIIGLLSYTIIVTYSRFGEDNAISSILYYFSHSMLSFNDGLATQIHTFANGKYFFKWFIDIFNGDSYINFQQLGTNFGTSFITFIGNFYLDFGPFGTFAIALIIPQIIINLFIKKRLTLGLPELSFLIFYFSYIANGVFVIGRGSSLQWLIALIIFYILKISEKYYIKRL